MRRGEGKVSASLLMCSVRELSSGQVSLSWLLSHCWEMQTCERHSCCWLYRSATRVR